MKGGMTIPKRGAWTLAHIILGKRLMRYVLVYLHEGCKMEKWPHSMGNGFINRFAIYQASK